ncbi:hypothetical protein M2132_002118 [Dysgonomonas sp. PH5-45]|nr:hypothetical protein [Dysgonomonas sp. PH5-45]MDH6388667.1 hypothetical protein [Dysgonomonas sp. PH5-37]
MQKRQSPANKQFFALTLYTVLSQSFRLHSCFIIKGKEVAAKIIGSDLFPFLNQLFTLYKHIYFYLKK